MVCPLFVPIEASTTGSFSFNIGEDGPTTFLHFHSFVIRIRLTLFSRILIALSIIIVCPNWRGVWFLESEIDLHSIWRLRTSAYAHEVVWTDIEPLLTNVGSTICCGGERRTGVSDMVLRTLWGLHWYRWRGRGAIGCAICFSSVLRALRLSILDKSSLSLAVLSLIALSHHCTLAFAVEDVVNVDCGCFLAACLWDRDCVACRDFPQVL
jgi:hypothetical protein